MKFSFLVFLALLGTQCFAIPVSTELALLVDVSGSVSTDEFELQRSSYVTAFQSTAVHDAIESSGTGVAASLIYWDDGAFTAVPWTQLSSTADSLAFADLISVSSRMGQQGGTSIDNALLFGARSIANNGFESSFQVIDISGDGANNSNGLNRNDTVRADNSADAANARDAVINEFGVDVVNGLVILDGIGTRGVSSVVDSLDDDTVIAHYEDSVVIGTNPNGDPAFVVTSDSFDVADQLTIKISEELAIPVEPPVTPPPVVQPMPPAQPANPIPEPSTVVVWAALFASAALVGMVRRRRES